MNPVQTISYEMIASESAEKATIEEIIRVVVAGGAVKEHDVRKRIVRKGVKLAIARCDAQIVGVAALKKPDEDYLGKVIGRAEAPIVSDGYPHELGYVSVSEAFKGNGIGPKLCTMMMEKAGNAGVFATTSAEKMYITMLPQLGFKIVGNTWEGKPDEETRVCPTLRLMVRPAS